MTDTNRTPIPSQPDPASYPQPAYPRLPYDQSGYGSQDVRYGREAYQGYPGHGTSGY